MNLFEKNKQDNTLEQTFRMNGNILDENCFIFLLQCKHLILMRKKLQKTKVFFSLSSSPCDIMIIVAVDHPTNSCFILS